MKKYLIILIYSLYTLAILQSCTNKPDYQSVRQQVLDQHDQLMMVSEKAMNTKIMLDTLNLGLLKDLHPELDTVTERKQILSLSKSLGDADDLMSDWMHLFKTDFKESKGEDALTYFTDEKVKVEKLDSLYKKHIEAANLYLKRFNLKSPANEKHSMKM